jgi:hypothetical protein
MPATDLLIPVRRRRDMEGRFRLPDPCVLASAHIQADRLPLRQLAGDLQALGLGTRVSGSKSAEAAVRVLRDKLVEGDEAYRLTVAPEGVEIRASTAAGAYYGVQTLRDLLCLHGRRLPATAIDDRPDFPRRGVYVDCSRGKVPKVATVKALIERLAHWKVNEVQLYLENTFRYEKHPAIGVGYSPFKPRDILAIQAHAKKHHVRLVGSLASFGHMEKILMLPEYEDLAEIPVEGVGRMGKKGTICPTDPRSIRLIEDLYDEFLPLTEAEDFNACCDETWDLGKGRSRKKAEKVGVGRLYLDFVLKLRKLCRKHGKRMNIWGDILLKHPELIGEVPEDVVLCNWGYNPESPMLLATHKFAEAGLPLVCCPGTNGWQSHGTRMEMSMGNVAHFAEQARRHGAEGLLNTDWGDFGHRNTLGVSLHGMAHGAACAWHGEAVRAGDFTERFAFFAFGDRRGRLAESLRTLGAWGDNRLYHALVEPVDLGEPFPQGRRFIEGEELAVRAAERLDEVRRLKFPAPGELDEFERIALDEFRLAAGMDALACRRVEAVLSPRTGSSAPARKLRSLAEDMRAMAADFEGLWRKRNRPSRLRDNLADIRRAADELEPGP